MQGLFFFYICQKNPMKYFDSSLLLFLLMSVSVLSCQNTSSGKIEESTAETNERNLSENLPVVPAANRTDLYFPLLEGKKVGIVANQTAKVEYEHLVDFLINSHIDIQVIFAPEHGFRGHAEAGEKVVSGVDPMTGIKVVSLYAGNFKPQQKDLEGIDVMIFDIQDVGARFYTYISTMHYVMEACVEAEIPLIILDRPNPNGFYVDGPVLQPEFKSFIGMHPIPLVHGLTVGELALMINGEGWLSGGMQCELHVIPVERYTHSTLYHLPVAPSPNLQSKEAIYLYPSLCLFEGTVVSVGRGTDTPFEIFGHPKLNDFQFSFVPESRPGFSASPPFMNETCFGRNLNSYADTIVASPKLELKWVIETYRHLHDKGSFFNANMFDKLAGTSELRKQIIAGMSEQEIRKSWKDDLDEYKKMRKKYLLYDDFE